MSNFFAVSGDLRQDVLRQTSAFDAAVPTGRARRAWLASAILAFACFMIVIAGLASVWAEQSRATGPAAPTQEAPPSRQPEWRWVDINRPLAIFDLAGGPYAGLPMHLDAQRWTGGPARRDVLTYGVPLPGEAFVRLLFDRHEPGTAEETTLFVDTARIAGTAGLAVFRSGLMISLPTRFGPFEVSDVTIGLPERSAPCLAFRRAGASLTIVGLMCGAGPKPVEVATLACTIDKIDLVANGGSTLRALFDAAEQQRGLGCSDARTIRGSADPLRPISSALRGTLDGGKGAGRQLSGLR